MSTPGSLQWLKHAGIVNYGVPVLSVGVVLIGELFVPYLRSAPVSLFICAVMLSGVVGGFGPSMLATVLSLLGYRGVSTDVTAAVGAEKAFQQAQAELAREDAGVGFGEAGTARLFEAFYRTKPAGLGMGLSISRSIMGSQGRLWATANPDHGATFHLALPGPR